MVCSKEDAVILDFFAGSGTTGQSVLELNKDGSKGNLSCALLMRLPIQLKVDYDVTSKEQNNDWQLL